jgi:predicted amino acid dehydrogenase
MDPMLANIWRALLAAADYRRALRLLANKPKLDVVFITNIRDEAERQRFFNTGADRARHASGPRLHLKGIAAAVRGINATADEMYTREGRKKAKAIFVEATQWAQDQGAKVVLLAASTKRLFGRDGAELKALFPNLVFTIGDNGTGSLLCQDVDRALAQAGLMQHGEGEHRLPRILVIGPYGLLGDVVSRHLLNQGHHVVGFGANAKLLHEYSSETGLPISEDLQTAGEFDLVVACTHSQEAKLSQQSIEWLRRSNRRLLVVDVAEPANLDAHTLAQCAHHVVRQDAGNAYASSLKYVLGAWSWRKLHLARGTVFGCFAEAMALYHAIYRQHDHLALKRNWFDINPFNITLVNEAFKDLEIGLPQAHCFGQVVSSFDLQMHPTPRLEDHPVGLPSRLLAVQGFEMG